MGQKSESFPISFGMFSREEDIAVGETIMQFLDEMDRCPELRNFAVGKERLDLLQDPEIVTNGGQMYDEFIGHVDSPLITDPLPESLFEEEFH